MFSKYVEILLEVNRVHKNNGKSSYEYLSYFTLFVSCKQYFSNSGYKLRQLSLVSAFEVSTVNNRANLVMRAQFATTELAVSHFCI